MSKFMTICAVVVATLVVILVGQKVVHTTGKYPFCGSCHEWDGAIAQTNLADPIHGASNKKGVVVTCTDCHLPHDNMIRYMLSKAKNGIAEGFTALSGDSGAKDWLANREHARKNYTFDSSCIRCHEGAFVKAEGNKTSKITSMHAKYLELKGGADEFKCTDCHKHVGHYELGKMLFDQKDSYPKSWQEWEVGQKEFR